MGLADRSPKGEREVFARRCPRISSLRFPPRRIRLASLVSVGCVLPGRRWTSQGGFSDMKEEAPPAGASPPPPCPSPHCGSSDCLLRRIRLLVLARVVELRAVLQHRDGREAEHTADEDVGAYDVWVLRLREEIGRDQRRR